MGKGKRTEGEFERLINVQRDRLDRLVSQEKAGGEKSLASQVRKEMDFLASLIERRDNLVTRTVSVLKSQDEIGDLANAVRFAAKEIGKEGAAGMGAIENLAVQTKEGLDDVAKGLEGLASAVSSLSI